MSAHLSEETKVAYKRHFCDIYFYLNTITEEDEEENTNVVNNIMLEGRAFQLEIKNLMDNGADAEVDDDFCDFVIKEGKRFLLAYYVKYADNFLHDLNKFVEENEFIMELCETLRVVINCFNERHPENNNQGSIRRRYGRRWQVHPVHQLRDTNGFYNNILVELKKYPEKFLYYTRMSERQFNFLLDLVTPRIEKCNLFRKTIPSEIRLLVTLRHLATGMEHENIALDYLIGKSTAQKIIPETCQAIYDVLQPLFVKWPDDLESIFLLCLNFFRMYCLMKIATSMMFKCTYKCINVKSGIYNCVSMSNNVIPRTKLKFLFNRSKPVGKKF